jgi:hypothetical protein
MRILAGLIASVMMAATGAGAQTAPTGLTGEVFKAEETFDAYTAEHGITEGFHAYSTPDAIAFRPEAVRIHERLGDAIAKGEGGKDAPSKLRWRPYRIAVAASGDMAWDMGPWTIEGTDRAGWFFTIWQKQSDGRWLWLLDTGAGTDAVDKLPPAGAHETLTFSSGGPSDPDAANSVAKRDAELNAALGAKPPADAYKTFSMQDMTYFGGGAVPATGRKTVKALLGARPQQGATWTTIGNGQSAARDMVYTYGHVTDATGAYLGHYVRVWTSMGGWHLAVDLYNSAK